MLTTLFVSAIMLEVSLRILVLFPMDSVMHINDSKIGYRLRPNLRVGNNRLNSFGFNDIEHSPKLDSAHTKIAIIGDSFVYGAVQREKNFTYILEKLAQKDSINIEILNMGIPAASPKNYLALLENDAVQMNSDIICVVFFIGNDITQSHDDFNRFS